MSKGPSLFKILSDILKLFGGSSKSPSSRTQRNQPTTTARPSTSRQDQTAPSVRNRLENTERRASSDPVESKRNLEYQAEKAYQRLVDLTEWTVSDKPLRYNLRYYDEMLEQLGILRDCQRYGVETPVSNLDEVSEAVQLDQISLGLAVADQEVKTTIEKAAKLKTPKGRLNRLTKLLVQLPEKASEWGISESDTAESTQLLKVALKRVEAGQDLDFVATHMSWKPSPKLTALRKIRADHMWARYNKEKLLYARQQDWGLYRNVIFAMGDQLAKEERLRDAVIAYSEVYHLDTNGPNNLGGVDQEMIREWRSDPDPEFRKLGLPFDLEMAFEAPGMISRLVDVIEEGGLSLAEVKELYLEGARRSPRTPRNPEQTWKMFRKHITVD